LAGRSIGFRSRRFFRFLYASVLGPELVDLTLVGDIVVGFSGVTCFAGGGKFIPELFELIFKKGLVSFSVDDFGGGCSCGSTVEGFISREP